MLYNIKMSAKMIRGHFLFGVPISQNYELRIICLSSAHSFLRRGNPFSGVLMVCASGLFGEINTVIIKSAARLVPLCH